MRKIGQLLGLFALVSVFIAMQEGWVTARVTGTSAPANDAGCWGAAGVEVCVDSSANIVPTTTGVGSLGTSTLKWNALQMSGNAAIGGTLAVTGATTLTGNVTNSGNVINTKTQVGTAQTALLGIYISTTIPVTTAYETILSSSGLGITLTSTPSISTTTVVGGSVPLASGTFLILTTTANISIILQDEGTLTGSKLQLGSATRAIGQYDTLMLIFDATDGYWREVGFVNN